MSEKSELKEIIKLLHITNERITHMALNLDALKAAIDALKKQADTAAAVAAEQAADQAQVDALTASITPPVVTPDAGGGDPPPPPPK